ncbi:hypothetical protein HYALB_00012161 [Hymenoscyphus albidus]|uniref:Uncharacterized protein n=1 Tax=Hymenoscyphus albidus TaxID=595503 RepID=A0A9N9LSB4_9HELO|nr:hypothetical protein HYALB_00012161 [Hymenoscyphus albidus]
MPPPKSLLQRRWGLSSKIAKRATATDGNISSSASTFSLPRDSIERNSDATASPPMSPGNSLARELPDALINFVLGVAPCSETPRKRQKKKGGQARTIGEQRNVSSREPELPHIEVRQTLWDIALSGSKLSKLNLPNTIERNHVYPYIKVFGGRNAEYIEIQDDWRQTVFHASIPEDDDEMEHVRVALRVDYDSKKWAKKEGKIWIDVGISLIQKEKMDILRISFTIYWHCTSSPQSIMAAKNKIPALEEILQKYFATESDIAEDSSANSWSPQDFYQSVHVPDKQDNVPQSLIIPELESDLYPFQKRSVQWMLGREGMEYSPSDKKIVDSRRQITSTLPLSFVPATDFKGKPCFVSHLLGLVTLDITPFRELERTLKGGILAEEMGLGKTLEMISLIALNKRPKPYPEDIFDQFTCAYVRPTSATLIIAPPTIAHQWIAEINKHAPSLKVIHYQGIKTLGNGDRDLLASSDIVVSTYKVLGDEIYYTPLNPEKTLRTKSKYSRPKSPLMELQFFRVIMDEAQMIERVVSNAAVVARMVPRVNAWCVTGTPVRKDVSDLLGLLVFLRYEPFASIDHVWSSLINRHKEQFRKLFGQLALRHNKITVRDELKLPAQRRYVITMPFNPIEEQHYRELFDQMCEATGLDTQGAPLSPDWDHREVADTMRKWLVRLRQIALHPEVGGRNRRALGNKDGPIRTVVEVLEAMIEHADNVSRTEQRNLILTKLKRGQLFENSPRVREALAIWTETAAEASVMVKEFRAQLQEELVRSGGNQKPARQEDDSEGDAEDVSSHVGKLRSRVRGALDLQHMAEFFCANAYYQIKTNKEMTMPESVEFEALEKLEAEGYESAKTIRREILQEASGIYGKADKLMRKISEKADSRLFAEIPEFPTDSPGGDTEGGRIMEEFMKLGEFLDAQAQQLDQWRKETIEFLLRPLVDEEDGLEITGDEYEESTKTQDEVIVYCTALKAAISDRRDALAGGENTLVRHEVEWAIKLAKKGEGHFPEKTLELLNIRKRLKPPKDIVRRCVAELRALTTSLRPDAEIGNTRARTEFSMTEIQLKHTQKILSQQMKATAALEQELELFVITMNTRLEYYKQLQHISDTVTPDEVPNNLDASLARLLHVEQKLCNKIAQAKTKRRFLEYLKQQNENPPEEQMCVICRESFEIGFLTVCGHQYCKECITLWLSTHRNCPECRKTLRKYDLHEITYKPQELTIQTEEVQDTQRRQTPSSNSRKSAIYSEISKSQMMEIKSIDLNGPSFTTKIDTLARHLIWLRDSDPGAKSIVYSQFKEFLDVLAGAFQRFHIGYSSIDRPNGIERFKEDPAVECFLLHARAHSSGLNLVNASHVILCEPLLNTALELQAIARVDRIGQRQETNVWLYLVDGTVEESIYQLSVKRRMEHLADLPTSPQSKGKGKGKRKAQEVSDEEVLGVDLEEANSMELQQVTLNRLFDKGGKGGERVDDEDLWQCLFGNASQRAGGQSGLEDSLGGEMGRNLRAEAAELREIEEL